MTEIDNIIEDALDLDLDPSIIPTCTPSVNPQTDVRERLIGIAVAGKSKEYLGKNITSDEISNLDEKELLKLYARYESYMGGLVTKNTKKHIINAYTNVVKLFLPKNLVISNQEALEKSLNEGLFVDLALSKLTCGLYHKYGHFLGPVEALLLTSNHVKKINNDKKINEEKTNSKDQE